MIPAIRRKEVLAWLDDRARDYSLNNREIALAKDAAALIREQVESPKEDRALASDAPGNEATDLSVLR